MLIQTNKSTKQRRCSLVKPDRIRINKLNFLEHTQKKAMFFTIAAIVLISLFLITYLSVSLLESRKSLATRIGTLNSFILSADQDLDRRLYIFGYRVIFLMEQKIADTATYIPNVNTSFQEAFYNGTFEGVKMEDLEGASFSELIQRLDEMASSVNAIISFKNPNFRVIQVDPWTIKLILEGDLSIRDSTGLVSWNRTSVTNSFISIQGFEDPVYYVETRGKVSNKITKTIYSPFNSTSLYSHAKNSFYINSTLAPNFLMRLEGNFSSDVNGIESLVYVPGLPQEYSVTGESCVDYLYFNSKSDPGSSVSGIPWLYLDNAHNQTYKIF